MIIYRCPNCEMQATSPPELGGQTITCPRCGAVVRVPFEAVANEQRAPSVPPHPPHPPMHAMPPTRSPVDWSVARVPKCSRLVYILLALFLGGFGVHNFVAGHTGSAVAQVCITVSCAALIFCTFGLSAIGLVAVGIWVLVEIVVITSDGNGVPLN